MVLKRTYTVPLRRAFRRTEDNQKTKKAIRAMREFLQKHMKSERVLLGPALNTKMWSRGAKNPPHKLTVVAEKNDEGVVYADLEGQPLPSEKASEEDSEKK